MSDKTTDLEMRVNQLEKRVAYLERQLQMNIAASAMRNISIENRFGIAPEKIRR